MAYLAAAAISNFQTMSLLSRITLFLVLAPHFFYAQGTADTTQTIHITGAIQKEIYLDIAGLSNYPLVDIGDIPIINHLGVEKKKLIAVRGVRAREVLSQLEFITENPKDLSEFYFVFTATDGYRVLFSWNEIFNNPLGGSLFFILERDGKKAEALDDSLAVISTTDLHTGRRYVKGLKTIVVGRAN